MADLVAQVRAGRIRAVARAISMVENVSPQLPALAAGLAADWGRAHIVGVTGSPGVGKSTCVAALVELLRAGGLRVGVLAVDPTSPFTGGALLGDRVRMGQHALDGEVFIRSMATRGHLGGLAVAAPQAVRVFDAAGCDVVVVETVGVGQSEVEVAAEADTTVVLLAPGMGDAVQAAKAGILEVGDVFVVNKSDRDGAHAVVRELRQMLSLAERRAGEWRPPVGSTVASKPEGVDELWAHIARHRAEAERSGAWAERRLTRARREVESLALGELRATLRLTAAAGLDELATAVRDGRLDAYAAAERALAAMRAPTAAASLADQAPPMG